MQTGWTIGIRKRARAKPPIKVDKEVIEKPVRRRRTKKTSEEKGPLPPSTRLAWEDLSVRWQSAAQSLGYTEKLWNDYKGDQGSIVVCRTRPRNFQVQGVGGADRV